VPHPGSAANSAKRLSTGWRSMAHGRLVVGEVEAGAQECKKKARRLPI
jgi:hypothetical protein